MEEDLEDKRLGELKAVYSGAVQAGEIRIAEMIKGGIDLIKKQQEEIEFYKSIIQTEKKKYKNTKKSLKGQLQNKNKIINEMAEELAEITGSCPLDRCDFDLDCGNRCDTDIEYKCWIDYFTKKVEGDK